MPKKTKEIFVDKSLKKLWKATATTLVAISSMVNANQSIGDCSQSCNPCCNRWSIDADFLYFTACEGGLSYGSESRAQTFGGTVGGSSASTHTKLKHPHQRWDVGYRLGIGYEICDCWDTNLTWTNFDTDGHAKQDEIVNANQWFTPAYNAIPGTGLAGGALLGGNAAAGENRFPVQFANAHWKLRLNLLDLEIGHEFCATPCLSLRPFIGVRGASINEKYRIRYETIVSTGASVVASVNDRVHLKNDFEGAGVRGGLDSEFDLGCGLSLYGGVAASLLYGETEIKTREVLIASPGVAGTVVEVCQKDSTCGCRAITDAEIGVRWQKTCCNRVVAFQLGWEHHFFFNQNQFEKLTNFNGTDNAGTDRYGQNHHGDLSVQGLVLSAKVYF
jgi:hypothetical protein